MMISVFGTGYVGTVTGTCFADLGNRVTCVDIDERKVERLKSGDPIIYEPGLEELLKRNHKAGRLDFTTDAARAVEQGDVIFICVGTPELPSGDVNLSYIEAVARTIGKHMRDYKLIVNKSTVPVGTADRVRRWVKEGLGERTIEFDVASNPEFLKEGMAVHDCQNPDRIVVGTDSERARDLMTRLYAPVTRVTKPIMFTSTASSELIKYASNAMLATRISFMNEISHLCEQVGADVGDVAKGMGLDTRIGPRFLQAGCGYGGSCFPKDIKGLAYALEQHGLPSTMLQAVDHINERQKKSVVLKLKKHLPELEGKTIAIWGLAFKPRTDDIREAPSETVIATLLKAWAKVRLFDPEAMHNMRQAFPPSEKVFYAKDAYEALEGADALLILTEWDEFRTPDLGKVKEMLKEPIVIDGRNVLSPNEMRSLGFRYTSVGRA